MNRLPDNTPEILRRHGLKVRVVPGWKTRGRPASTGRFNPVGVLCHHTATTVAWTVAAVLRLLTGGRSDLPGPLCQFGLDRKGTVWLVAAGRANHAGQARSVGSVAAGDGNELYIGIEAFNAGAGEPWPAAQYNAYVLLVAVIQVELTGSSSRAVAGHKETSTTGKVDPSFEMDPFRQRVDAMMKQIEGEDETPTPVRGEVTRGGYVDAAISDLRKANAQGVRKKKIKAALRELKSITPMGKKAA